MIQNSQWIGVDLDGTLAHYDYWRGAFEIGAPVPAMVARVQGWLEQGREVRVFTARMSDRDVSVRDGIRTAVFDWTLLHVGTGLIATCVKDYMMVELWDDRAVGVEFNTGAVRGGLRETV